METKSNKKTITIAVIVLAVVVIASGAYYGYNRWQQQRLVSQYYQTLYGAGAPGVAGLLGGGTGGGLSADAVKAMAELQAEEDAKQEAQDAADAKKEAAKTPEDKYDEAEAAYLSGNVSSLFDQVAKSNVEAIFDKCKIISSTIGYTGVGGFVVQIIVPEKVTAEKFDQLTQKFTDQGYISSYGEITANAGMVMLVKDDTTSITLSFDVDSDEQGITIMYAVNE